MEDKFGFAEKTFEEVVTIVNGKNQKKVESLEGKYPIYGSGGIMGYANDYICEANTVVIGRKGSINNPIYVEEPFWNVDTAFGLVAHEESLLPKYLFYFCKYYDFEKLNTTVTIPSLTKANLLKIRIRIPEIGQQAKIVKILDKVYRLIQLKKCEIEELDILIKARFVELFENKDFPSTSFSDYADIIDGDRGKNYPKAEEFFSEGYCLFLNAKNVTKNGFDFEKVQFISKEKDELLRKGKLIRGDIVITTRGTIGNIAYYDETVSYKNLRINSGMVIIRPKEVEYNPVFFLNAFKYKVDEIKEHNVTGAAQPQLPIHIMSKIQLLRPPIDLQNEFADFVKQTDKLKVEVQKSLDEMQTLFDSLMQKYFG